jgi:hypothetical protein
MLRIGIAGGGLPPNGVLLRTPGCLERVGSRIAGRSLNGGLRVARLSGGGGKRAVAEADSGNRDHSQHFGGHAISHVSYPCAL